MTNSSRCKCGYTEELIEHTVVDCPLYAKERSILNKKLKNNKTPLPIDIIKTLKTPDSKNSKFITEFLHACNLFV